MNESKLERKLDNLQKRIDLMYILLESHVRTVYFLNKDQRLIQIDLAVADSIDTGSFSGKMLDVECLRSEKSDGVPYTYYKIRKNDGVSDIK